MHDRARVECGGAALEAAEGKVKLLRRQLHREQLLSTYEVVYQLWGRRLVCHEMVSC